MRLRTKLEKLEKELKARSGETKLIIRHEMINEDGEIGEVRIQEIVLSPPVPDTENAKGGNPS